MSNRLFAALSIFVSCALAAPAGAVTIDFESGTDLSPVGSIMAGGVTATFSCGAVGDDCFYVAYGSPTTAFVPNDTPEAGFDTGEFGATDEADTALNASLDYLIEFDSAVTGLSLLLMDYRGDGGGGVGQSATLEVFSDSFATSIGSDTFTVPAGVIAEGNVEMLSVGVAGIRSAKLSFPRDVGTAIDNVTFNEVPEPASLVLLALGLVGLGVGAKRRYR